MGKLEKRIQVLEVEIATLQRETDSWKARYVSICKAVPKLEQRIVELQTYVDMLQKERDRWNIERTQQQQVMQTALNEHNRVVDSILHENEQLKRELKTTKDGSLG